MSKEIEERDKIIEEIAQDLAIICPDLVDDNCGGTPCYYCIAESLYTMRYRKVK